MASPLQRFLSGYELARALDCPVTHITTLMKRNLIVPDAQMAGRPIFSERSLPLVRHVVVTNPPRSYTRRMELEAGTAPNP